MKQNKKINLIIGNLYKTKARIAFFEKSTLFSEYDVFDKVVGIPKDSIFLLLDIQPTNRHKMYMVLWDNKILKREIGYIPNSWFEEI